jgi:hypothetical protein
VFSCLVAGVPALDLSIDAGRVFMAKPNTAREPQLLNSTQSVGGDIDLR